MFAYQLQRVIFSLSLLHCAVSSAGSLANQGEGPMYDIRVIIGGQIINASLKDSAATRGFLAQLPLDLELKDYSGTEKIAYLPRKLDTSDAPDGIDPVVGDVTYYAPWGNLAIFYEDFGYSLGLIKLGTISSGLENLRYSGAKSARIERVRSGE